MDPKKEKKPKQKKKLSGAMSKYSLLETYFKIPVCNQTRLKMVYHAPIYTEVIQCFMPPSDQRKSSLVYVSSSASLISFPLLS